MLSEQELLMWSAGFDCGVAAAKRLMNDGIAKEVEKAKEQMERLLVVNHERKGEYNGNRKANG